MLLLPILSFSQKWEVGGFVGGANYSGDIDKVPSIRQTGIGFGALGIYNTSNFFALRMGLNYGRISADDGFNPANKTRNLSFYSNIFELNTLVEFNFFPFGTTPLTKPYTTYVFTGLSFFYFNPKADLDGIKYDLQPLGTEGQTLDGNKKYSRVNMAIPLGVGFKFLASKNWVIGIETGFRRTFTDYLDDVSKTYPDLVRLAAKEGDVAVRLSDRSGASAREQLSSPGDTRGNPRYKDWYIFTGIKVTYRLTPINCSFSRF